MDSALYPDHLDLVLQLHESPSVNVIERSPYVKQVWDLSEESEFHQLLQSKGNGPQGHVIPSGDVSRGHQKRGGQGLQGRWEEVR